MPFLPFRMAVLVVLCLLLLGGLPPFAVAFENTAPGEAEDKAEEDGWQPPVRMPPVREPQTLPAVLKNSILETLVEVEEEARRQTEEEARKEAGQREREERAEAIREQQEFRESVRILRERQQARGKVIADAVKIAMPPHVAVVPAKKNWPLPKFIEDPAWNTPELALIYQSVYTENDIKVLYRLLLMEAVSGNPRAMMVLAYAYNRWGGGISGTFSVLHPSMHNGNYWRRWAVQLSSPDWVELRFGDLSLDVDEKIAHYKNAAVYRNGEALYKLALLEDRPELLVEAAMVGEPGAASIVAFNLGMGTDGFPASPRLASFYWWRGALSGDVRSMLACSEYFYQGKDGFPKDDRQAYLFALLALREAQKQAERDSWVGAITPTVERHLIGLTAAMGLEDDDIWAYRQELNILMAAPEEEKIYLRALTAPQREATLVAMGSELFAVREVLKESPPDDSEQQILTKLEQTMAEGNMELARSVSVLADDRYAHDNRFFLLLCLGAAVLVLGSYLAMRLRLYAFIVRLVSVHNGELA